MLVVFFVTVFDGIVSCFPLIFARTSLVLGPSFFLVLVIFLHLLQAGYCIGIRAHGLASFAEHLLGRAGFIK